MARRKRENARRTTGGRCLRMRGHRLRQWSITSAVAIWANMRYSVEWHGTSVGEPSLPCNLRYSVNIVTIYVTGSNLKLMIPVSNGDRTRGGLCKPMLYWQQNIMRQGFHMS